MAKLCRMPTNLQRGMLEDICETPQVFRNMLELHFKGDKADFPKLRAPLQTPLGLKGKTPLEVLKNGSLAISKGDYVNKLVIVGCGTSYNAALLGEYLLETVARIPVEVQYASEYRHREPLLRPGDVLVVVSASGETPDALACISAVRRSKSGADVMILGVTTQEDCSMARESDAMIIAPAGYENGIAATKAFSATGLAFVLLSFMLGEACGTLEEKELVLLAQQLKQLPAQAQAVLESQGGSWIADGAASRKPKPNDSVLWDISCHSVLAQNFIFLGRGFCFPVALEGATKCKELAYIHAEGYPAAEMKHGPIALIDQFMPVVVIAPRSDPTFLKTKANIEEVKARSGSVICITDAPVEEFGELCEHMLCVPATHEYFFPLLSVLPLQLLAYMMGILRGNEVDHPRNLCKIAGDVPSTAGAYPSGAPARG